MITEDVVYIGFLCESVVVNFKHEYKKASSTINFFGWYGHNMKEILHNESFYYKNKKK